MNRSEDERARAPSAHASTRSEIGMPKEWNRLSTWQPFITSLPLRIARPHLFRPAWRGEASRTSAPEATATANSN